MHQWKTVLVPSNVAIRASVDWRVVDEYMSCHSLFPGVALSQISESDSVYV